jgi:hypothetical protein
MTITQPTRSADIVYQDFARECYIWIWCNHETQNYIIHKSMNPEMDIAKFYIDSRQDMRDGLLEIEEDVNLTVMKPQWHRLRGERIVLNMFNLYCDDREEEDDTNLIINQ